MTQYLWMFIPFHFISQFLCKSSIKLRDKSSRYDTFSRCWIKTNPRADCQGRRAIMAAEGKDVVVELGFVEKSPSWKLHSKFFPSKVMLVVSDVCVKAWSESRNQRWEGRTHHSGHSQHREDCLRWFVCLGVVCRARWKKPVLFQCKCTPENSREHVKWCVFRREVASKVTVFTHMILPFFWAVLRLN